MKLSRLTGFAATALLSLLLFLTGCGDTFRPVVNPVPSPTPDPQQAGIAVVLQSAGSLNGGISCVDGSTLPCRPGAATQIDVSGDTVLNNQQNVGIGRNPVHATFVTSGTNTFAQVVVANRDSDNVSVYNPSFAFTPSVVSLAAGAAPVFVATTPDGSKAYVANSGTNTASVITPASATLVTSINLDAGSGASTAPNIPKVMTPTADGSKVYVANDNGTNDNGTVSVISTSSNTLLTTISSLGGVPVWAEANSAGTAVFVLYCVGVDVVFPTTTILSACAGSASIAVINPSTNSIITTIGVDAGSNYMIFDRNLQHLYVSGGGNVDVFNAAPQTPTLLTSVSMPAGGGTPVSLTALANGTNVYIATDATTGCASEAGRGRVYVMNAAAPATPTTCITVGGTPVWTASSANSGRVYVAHQGAGVTLMISGVPVPQPVGTTIVSTATNQVVTEIPASFQDPACTTACTYEKPVFVMANR